VDFVNEANFLFLLVSGASSICRGFLLAIEDEFRSSVGVSPPNVPSVIFFFILAVEPDGRKRPGPCSSAPVKKIRFFPSLEMNKISTAFGPRGDWIARRPIPSASTVKAGGAAASFSLVPAAAFLLSLRALLDQRIFRVLTGLDRATLNRWIGSRRRGLR